MYWRKGEQWGDKGACAPKGLRPPPWGKSKLFVDILIWTVIKSYAISFIFIF